jgi:hypothetical protein
MYVLLRNEALSGCSEAMFSLSYDSCESCCRLSKVALCAFQHATVYTAAAAVANRLLLLLLLLLLLTHTHTCRRSTTQ